MAEDKQTPPDKQTAPEKATPSYEQAREELTEVVRRLETGGLTLEQSIELWERGERLAAICEEWLQGARAKLAAAMAQRQEPQPNGPGEAPF
ncbi:exodeoxyribonuclease VII small subunit [Microbispora hainanensis]|uniref:Exodeoxyribonuclease 7 small subunit n=1 Tax=Microbispora hainanensis TaxID=568844 RepID=A0A544YTE4_9ACTN|nr:exodeoxyribonuclease VII small subunit [Microbispora hainanensis]TQS20055.1 exodeoxyribonuclease VII small subunit [Microbispora hainanensis]